MIESVAIKDFQSIENVDIEFAPGFNVLVGPSNSGKSAVLRAMRGAIRNEIAPSFVRNGTRKATISISFDDHTIGADRGKSLSTYHLDDKEFTKCGKDVPQPILDVLQMNLVNGEDLNFQFQFDSPFLISASGSTVAQVIGTLTNVTLLFHAVQEANRRYLRASSELTIRLSDIESEKNKVEQFHLLETRNLLLPTLEQKASKYKEFVAAIDSLSRLVTDITRVQDSIPTKVELPDLSAEFAQYHELETASRELTQAISRIESVRLSMPVKVDLPELSADFTKYHELEIDSRELSLVISKIGSTESSIQTWKTQLLANQETLSTIATEFCPTCGQKLPESGRLTV